MGCCGSAAVGPAEVVLPAASEIGSLSRVSSSLEASLWALSCRAIGAPREVSEGREMTAPVPTAVAPRSAPRVKLHMIGETAVADPEAAPPATLPCRGRGDAWLLLA